VPYPGRGVVLAEKTAKMLHAGIGDEIQLKLGSRRAENFVVEGIVENYVQHYVFMSPQLFVERFEEEPDYNQLVLRYPDTSEDFEQALGREMMSRETVLGVSFTTALETQITDMLKALDIVVWVLILSAGALAFVVLYNLNSININVKNPKILSNHPSSSYKLIERGKIVEKLEITDPAAFWERSKFLVIVAD
jgi:putative ABC transport system permease protein